ncbi:MAG: glycosyltransferase family 39 protein [Candidatus Marinimicrobia bacterium]|nr:glycosyltransferase family 39 protein [Candidatus Neomarinimicrobiota bacterium]
MNQFSVSLWGDEAWAATLAIKPYWQIITTVARDTSPPLYYLLYHTWIKFFGITEISIRLLSFCFFLGTVITVFFLGKHLWDKKTGVLAALFALTNPFLFTYAFEGRMYALLALTSTLSVYFFLKKNRPGFILASAAALYSHHFSLFIIIFEALWRFFQVWRQPLKKIVKNYLDFFLIGLLYLPWLYPLYYQISLVGGGFWLGKPTPEVFLGTVIKFLVGDGQEMTRQLALLALVVTLLLKKWFQERTKTLFLLSWFFVPLILTYFVSQFFQSIFYDRYMLMVIPASSLLMASLRRKFSFVFILLTVFLLTSLNYHYFTHPTKRPFRELAETVKSESPNLVLINYSAASHHLFESKYYDLKAPLYAPQPLPFYVGTALMEKEDIISQLPDEEEMGVITSASPEEVNLPGFQIEKSQRFDGLYFLWLNKL